MENSLTLYKCFFEIGNEMGGDSLTKFDNVSCISSRIFFLILGRWNAHIMITTRIISMYINMQNDKIRHLVGQ